MKPEVEWALVADAQHCRVLERQVPFGAWRELPGEAEETHNRPSHERGTERPGRSHESAGSARHAIEPKTDPHREAKHGYARHLANRLEAAAPRYARLVLVAPPAFLGDLRDVLGEEARKRLAGSLDKDLTKHALADLAPLLDSIRPA
jgi:protein required for attachment to host cells